ncbi:MAG: hypothetical protein AB8D52_01230 [Gammaproteobacteria bacterium]
MNIRPTIGIDDLFLGMNRHHIIDLLGQPIQSEKEYGGESWLYEKGLELSFKKEDLYLLGSITATNSIARLEARQIIGLTEKELVESFPFLVRDDDFEENGKAYICNKRELMVWVSDNVVINVTIFPVYDRTGEIPLWPDFSSID